MRRSPIAPQKPTKLIRNAENLRAAIHRPDCDAARSSYITHPRSQASMPLQPSLLRSFHGSSPKLLGPAANRARWIARREHSNTTTSRRAWSDRRHNDVKLLPELPADTIRDALFLGDYSAPFFEADSTFLPHAKSVSFRVNSSREREVLCAMLTKVSTAHDIPRLVHVAKQMVRYQVGEGLKFEASTKALDKALAQDQKATIPEWRELLKIYNAAMDKARSQGYLDPLVGILLAARSRSHVALRYYFDMLKQTPDPGNMVGDVIALLHRWVSEDTFDGWEGQRRRQGLHFILAGEDGRSLAFLDRMWDSRWDTQRKLVVAMLTRLSDPFTIYEAWTQFRASRRYRECINGTRLEHKGAISDFEEIVHYHAEALIKTGAPDLAWRLVNSVRKKAQIGDKTWGILLDHPEHNTYWHNDMRSPVLKKYEAMIQNMEQALGIQWTEGENGTHVFVDDEGDVEHIDAVLIGRRVQESSPSSTPKSTLSRIFHPENNWRSQKRTRRRRRPGGSGRTSGSA
jgi:hypothetical protein